MGLQILNFAPLLGLQQYDRKQLPESHRKAEGHKLQKGLDALTSSLNYIGGTIGNAFEVCFYTYFKLFECTSCVAMKNI